MFPGRVGGSESYARGLLGEYAAGRGPERVTVLANRHVAASDTYPESGPVTIHNVRSYRPGDSDLTRYLALQWARIAPRAVARDVPDGLDLVHYPVTIPVPRVAGVPSIVSV